MTSIQDPDGPMRHSTTALQQLLDVQLSFRSRLGYVALLLCALMMSTIIGALWVTEPTLPLRTQVGFAVMMAIGFSWVAFAAWVLKLRRPLFARHRIIAGRMAVGFTSLFVIGTLAVGATAGGHAPFAAGSAGVAMLVIAIILLVRAHRAFARLIERRAVLERELAGLAK